MAALTEQEHETLLSAAREARPHRTLSCGAGFSKRHGSRGTTLLHVASGGGADYELLSLKLRTMLKNFNVDLRGVLDCQGQTILFDAAMNANVPCVQAVRIPGRGEAREQPLGDGGRRFAGSIG